MCTLGFVCCVPLEFFVPSFYTIKERRSDAEEQIIFNYCSYLIINHQNENLLSVSTFFSRSCICIQELNLLNGDLCEFLLHIAG